MRKGQLSFIGVVLGLAFLCFLLLLVGGGREWGEWNAEGRTITVDDDGGAEFTTIGEAVNASVDGDDILVHPGNYTGGYYLNYSVTIRSIQGREQTFLFMDYLNETIPEGVKGPQNISSVFVVNAENVTIEGFTFLSIPHPDEVHREEGNITMSYLQFISLNDTSNVSIRENAFLTKPDAGPFDLNYSVVFFYGISIHGENSSTILIEGNDFEIGYACVYAHMVSDFTFRGNMIRGLWWLPTEEAGQLFPFGIMISIAENISLTDNTFQDLGSAIFGVGQCSIANNTFHNVTRAVDITGYSSGQSRFTNNTFWREQRGTYGQISVSFRNMSGIVFTGNRFENGYYITISQCMIDVFNNNSLNDTELELTETSVSEASGNSMDGRSLKFIVGLRDRTIDIGEVRRLFIIESESVVVENAMISDTEIGITILNSENIHLVEAIMRNISYMCIDIRNSTGCIIEESDFVTCKRGVVIQQSNESSILNCTFVGVEVAIRGSNSNGLTVQTCWISDGETALYTQYFNEVIMEECTIDNMDDGVDSYSSNGLSISGCNFTNLKSRAIAIDGGNDLSVIRNSVSGTPVGISLLSSSDANVSRNQVRAASEHAMEVRASDKNIMVFENTLKWSGFGLYIEHSKGLSIVGNSLTNSTSGVKIEGSTGSYFEGNAILGNEYGVYFTSIITGSLFRNNIISGNEFGAFGNNPIGKLDMVMNDWGSDSGPYHPINNTNGTGNSVSDDISFTPWVGGSIDQKDGDSDDDWFLPIPIIPFSIVSLSLLGLILMTMVREDLRFLLLALLTAPLYTKLEKDDILEQPKRQEIYSFVVNKPGSNLTLLHKELPIGYGTLVHHLKVLEREKHIRSKKEMGRKLFFPSGLDWATKNTSRGERERAEMILTPSQESNIDSSISAISPTPREENSANINAGAGGRPDSLDNLSSVPVGLRILEHLKKNGTATPKEMEEVLGAGRTTVGASLRNLVNEGRVRKVEAGVEEKEGAQGATYELTTKEN